MAGIKIHQYPLERTSIGDEDYYDIDYYTGSGYQSAKIKGSTLKNVLGANYIDITTYISGYELTDKDAGKLITNSNANVRTLVIPSGLALPNNMITVKGRIGIQPETGVNITLPDGSTITEPTQFTCEADEVYILHKSAFTGDNYILVSVKKSENIGTNDLIITDTIRELQVATDGTLQIVTNDTNNSAIFRVGENSNERFSEIEFNTVIFDLVSKFQNPSITAGVIVEVNPNEFKFIVLPDTSNTSVYHGLIKADANKTIIEKSNAGKFLLDSSLSSNTFEDLSPTKKGLQYNADYSADYTDRSLVDKAYVVANSGAQIYNGTDITPLTKRNKLRFSGYLEAVDDAGDAETQVDLSSTALKESNIARFGLNSSDEVDLVIPENKILTGDSNGFATTLTGTEGSLIGFGASNEVQEFEAIEVYNILKEEGITADKTLALLDISGLSTNVKAKFNIDTIAFQNNTANSVTVNVGTTVGGTDVVNALVIGANALVLAPLGTTFFSITTTQNLYISSGSWNSANIDIHIKVSKIWQ